MNTHFLQHITQQLTEIQDQNLFKSERIITSAQGAEVDLDSGQHVINLCANNYLGLAQHPEVRQAAIEGLQAHGYGLASVRFICGTQDLHKQLEQTLADFLGFEDCILYPSCFDANGGLFETLLGAEDAVISDQLNHASIIDGVRLCKAKRYRYANNDMQQLEQQLQQADKDGARFKLITIDGVFSMDGIIARLDEICDLAERYQALVHVDDSHAVGFLGEQGRGTHEYRGCMQRIDITTGTLGKALGGAGGGYTAASKPIVELLRQRSRPYLFSNTLSPSVAAGALKAIEICRNSTELRQQLQHNSQYFREGLTAAGFDLVPGEHPIIPVMFYEAEPASRMAAELLQHGVYVVAFSFPVVPKGKARIRTQISAAHTQDELDQAIEAFSVVRKQLRI